MDTKQTIKKLKTSKMKKIQLAHFMMLITFILASCTKISNDKKNNQQGTYQVYIEGFLNLDLKIQGNCTNVFAMYADFSNQGLPNIKSLTIEGKDDQNRLIAVSLYFYSLPFFQNIISN
jgi:hypothetical protein